MSPTTMKRYAFPDSPIMDEQISNEDCETITGLVRSVGPLTILIEADGKTAWISRNVASAKDPVPGDTITAAIPTWLKLVWRKV